MRIRRPLRPAAAGVVVAPATAPILLGAAFIHNVRATRRRLVVADQQRRGLRAPSTAPRRHRRHRVVRGPGGGYRRVLGGEPAGPGRVRARVPRHAGRAGAGGGHQAAPARQRAGRPRVPRRGGEHRPRPPPPPRVPARLLRPRPAAPPRLRARVQRHPRLPPPRHRRRPYAGLGAEVEDRARVGQRIGIPARGLLMITMISGHPKIIHRDIKAANILLDDNFEPKVSDFGLAKIQHGDDSHVSTRVMGTFGYMAPEYTSTGKITDRSDVFSFGVVLLEIITGMRAVLSDEPDNDETLVSWARPLLTKALEEQISDELIDPILEANYDAHEMQRLIACAAVAVRHTARSRPRMSQIVRYLEGELPLEALNAGVEPGQSQTNDDGATEQLRRMRRMAFLQPGADGHTGATGFVSEATSEYGLYASSSSSGDDDDAQRTSRPRAGEHGATSRRTRPGRAGLL